MVVTDTTDVQSVSAAPHDTSNAIILQCSFITGSDARGCLIVLLGESQNSTINMTREGLCAFGTINVLSNISEVIAFVVESDGSVGDVAIAGVIQMNVTMMSSCIPNIANISTKGYTEFHTGLVGETM